MKMIEVTTITEQAHKGLEPTKGNLNGTYQDVLDYLNWSINVFASQGNMDMGKKGKAFADAVKTLHNRFGVRISKHFLKQFCQMEYKSQHIDYMLKLANYSSYPSRANFWGEFANGGRLSSPRIYDILISKQEEDVISNRLKAFEQKCIAEWANRDMRIEEQKLNASKLQIVASLSEEEVSSTEMEEAAPDLQTPDFEIVKDFQKMSIK